MSRERWSSWASAGRRSSIRGFVRDECSWTRYVEIALACGQLTSGDRKTGSSRMADWARTSPVQSEKERIMRPSGRKPDELRKVSFERGISKHAEGSCLVRFGDTHVLCLATARGKGAALAQGRRQGLGHGRIWHAAARHRRAHAARGGAGQAVGPHPGNPAPGRPLAARRGRSRGVWASARSPSTATSSRPMAAPAPPRSPAAGSRFMTASNG